MKGKQETIYKKLRELTNDDGVERVDLYDFLGPELRAALGIREGDRDELDGVRSIVKQKLEELIEECIDSHIIDSGIKDYQKARRSVRVAYNLDDRIPEDDRHKLEKRHQWAYQNLDCYVQSTTNSALRKTVITKFVDNLCPEEQVEEQAKAKPRSFWTRPMAVSLLALFAIAILLLVVTVWPAGPHANRRRNEALARSNSPQPSMSASQSRTDSPATGHVIAVDPVQYKTVKTIGLSYAFPQMLSLTPSQLAELNGLRGDIKAARSWAFKRGGVVAQNAELQIVLHGNDSATAIITDMNVKANCQAPLKGTLLFDAPGGGEDKDIGIGFNLDKPFPVAQEYDNNRGLGQPYFSVHTISLKPGEDQTIVVHVLTNMHYCTFTLQAEISIHGRTVVQSINNNGKPFAVTAIANSHNGMKWADYKSLYVGGVLSPPDSTFKPKNPKAFDMVVPDYG